MNNIIFESEKLPNEVYIGKNPQLADEKMTPDCLRCYHCWFEEELGYYCGLDNSQCYFEEI